MAKNILVINVDIRETRVALIENGIIAELHIERESLKGTLGNIYLGKVSRVLPGMQAAFIDVGLERAAFLHVEDLIRPDDFEAYLAGHRQGGATATTAGVDRAAGPALEDVAHEHLDELAPDEPEHDAVIELPTALDAAPDPDSDEAPLRAESEDADLDDGEEHEDEAREDVAFAGVDAHEAGDDVDVDLDDADEDVDAPDEGDDDDANDDAELSDEAGDEEADLVEPAGIDGEPVHAEHADEHDVTEHIPAAEEFSHSVGVGPVLPGAEPGAMVELGPNTALEVMGEGQVVVRVREPRARGRVRRSGRTRDRVVEAASTSSAAVAVQPKPQTGEQQRDRRGGREGREGRGGREQGREGGRGRGQADRQGRGQAGRRDGHKGASSKEGSERGRHNEPPRVSKATPIREVVREGQEVIVQISKEPIGTKGARVTSHVSLPGRYVVYLPTVDHVGISKRIGSEKERARLRESIESMKPPTGGLIVRTLAEGLTKKQLKADVGYLVRLWGEVAKKRESGVRAPTCIYTELDLILKTARDLFTDDIEKIVIDDRDEYIRLRRFVEMFMPERVDAIELYEGGEPIFDAYGIEEEIARALSRKVPLPSGGHLIIDQAEALTAIDVNTGRFVGKGSKDLEDTILKTNLEAVEEIAYQLRFRNIGGLIILDLIDMERANNREKVRRTLEQLLAKDKAKTTLNRISDLGLIEMTRKRTRESLGRTIHEPCFYCDGTGQLQSKQTIAYEILRQIRRERLNLPGYKVVVNAHPAVVDYFKSDERAAVAEAERLFQRRIELVARKEYHLEQFDLQGK
jgi:ribonuclease G